jgi:hypothetical protein
MSDRIASRVDFLPIVCLKKLKEGFYFNQGHFRPFHKLFTRIIDELPMQARWGKLNLPPALLRYNIMFMEPHYTNPISGSIEVIVGSKTEELIRRLRRAQTANQAVAIFKPAIAIRGTARGS